MRLPPLLAGVVAASLCAAACAGPSSARGSGPGPSGPTAGPGRASRESTAPSSRAADGGVAPAASSPGAGAAAALARFAASLRDGRWPDAWALLSATWRARLAPERLAADWRESGPVGPRALARVEASLAAGVPVRVQPDGRAAWLPVGEGKAAALVLEDGRWSVDALE